MRRGPHFVIIGAMKAATSTLHVQLAAQSGVFMTEPKEPNFFSDDDQYARGIEWYESLFETAPEGAIRGESSTHYTKLPTHPDTIERMHRHLGGNERFIYVIRHPIDRLVSQYVHEWTQRVIRTPLEDAVDAHPELIAYSRCALQLEPYIGAFGRERMLLVFFEALVAQPQRELERVARFVGVDGPVVWRTDQTRQNVSSERLRKSRLRDSLLNFPGAAMLRRALVPKSWRDRLKRLWTMNDCPQLSVARRAELERLFDDDLRRLGDWIGCDLSCATYDSITRAVTPDWKPPALEAAS